MVLIVDSGFLDLHFTSEGRANRKFIRFLPLTRNKYYQIVFYMILQPSKEKKNRRRRQRRMLINTNDRTEPGNPEKKVLRLAIRSSCSPRHMWLKGRRGLHCNITDTCVTSSYSAFLHRGGADLRSRFKRRQLQTYITQAVEATVRRRSFRKRIEIRPQMCRVDASPASLHDLR